MKNLRKVLEIKFRVAKITEPCHSGILRRFAKDVRNLCFLKWNPPRHIGWTTGL